MSWLSKLLPPKIKREHGAQRRGALPEGLWSKCPSCEAVLYATDLDNNQQVCPKCGHHNRLNARQRLELLLDPEACFEIGAEILPVDSLKFKDSKRYPDRLMEANESSGESDSLVCLQGSIKNIPVVAAAFEFGFMGGSMGSDGDRAKGAIHLHHGFWRCAHAGRPFFTDANGQNNGGANQTIRSRSALYLYFD